VVVREVEEEREFKGAKLRKNNSRKWPKLRKKKGA